MARHWQAGAPPPVEIVFTAKNILFMEYAYTTQGYTLGCTKDSLFQYCDPLLQPSRQSLHESIEVHRRSPAPSFSLPAAARRQARLTPLHPST
jgi:hypothetical protein